MKVCPYCNIKITRREFEGEAICFTCLEDLLKQKYQVDMIILGDD